MDFKTSSAGKNGLKRIERAIETMNARQMGCCGSEYIDDTDDHTAPSGGHYVAIFACTAAALDASSMPGSNISDLGDAVIPAGSTIYGYFPVISLGSGTVIAYKNCGFTATDSGD
ncbi:MAG: hypothetical protein GOVbin1709_91 [Prokaryotic dsDNA virus sp.]|nr:MAG: hypothetical protein GOVbin1709_91 [Prokaryotic dsDNA virus sp.]|tara:strand:+ start:1415 stop:1759 length:345 start_codon:yes stop_codon:yes gene_type:complete